MDAALGAFLLVYVFQWMTGRRQFFQLTPVHALILLYMMWLLLSFALQIKCRAGYESRTGHVWVGRGLGGLRLRRARPGEQDDVGGVLAQGDAEGAREVVGCLGMADQAESMNRCEGSVQESTGANIASCSTYSSAYAQ